MQPDIAGRLRGDGQISNSDAAHAVPIHLHFDCAAVGRDTQHFQRQRRHHHVAQCGYQRNAPDHGDFVNGNQRLAARRSLQLRQAG